MLLSVCFDNADHNVNTIDGVKTFHAMGGMMCVTPSSLISSEPEIPRIKKNLFSIGWSSRFCKITALS